MFSIIPRETEFFNLFEKAATTVKASAELYCHVLQTGPHRAGELERIRGYEHECDRIVHTTLTRLDRTFLTPFDREDIQLLMRRIDGVVDAIDAASKRLLLYQVEEVPTGLTDLADILAKAAAVVHEAMPHMRNLRRTEELRRLIRKIDAFEKDADDVHHNAIATLYAEGGDPLRIMKFKEILDITERAVDRCEDVANVMETILLKSA